MKITRLDLRNLRNEEWFQFFTEFKGLVEKYNPDMLNIAELFSVFVGLLANADEAIEKISKSLESDLMVEADAARDSIFRGMADAVKSALHHFDPSKQQAAKQLQIIFNTYSNLSARPYNEETAGIYNFLQDIRKSNYLSVLGLEEWASELERKNTDFETLVASRNANAIGKTELKMVESRRKTDLNYRDMVARIEALAIVNGEAAYSNFVREWNTNIDRYNRLLAQRKGKNTKKEGVE